jgi:hypothetical protein
MGGECQWTAGWKAVDSANTGNATDKFSTRAHPNRQHWIRARDDWYIPAIFTMITRRGGQRGIWRKPTVQGRSDLRAGEDGEKGGRGEGKKGKKALSAT